MKRTQTMGLAILAIFAMSAVVASGAQAATEGPFYKVATSRAFGSKEIKAEATKSFVLKTPTAGVTITCTALKVKAGATIKESTVGNAGTSSETIEYSGCTGGSAEGGTCKPAGGAITTEPVTNTLGYSTATRTGAIEILFKPTTGSTFAKIKFEGTKCFLESTTVTGTVVGTAETSTEKVVEVGANEVEEASGLISFTTAAKTIWTESGKELTETKAKVTAYGDNSTLEGVSKVTLASGEKFGIFT
jgi:hypothetical protein